jgi:hypothetical protein
MDSAIYAKRNGPDHGIQVRSHPLPFTRTEDVFLSAVSTLLIAIAIVIGFAFVSAFYASFLVNERENSAKHQQVRGVCGVSGGWGCPRHLRMHPVVTLFAWLAPLTSTVGLGSQHHRVLVVNVHVGHHCVPGPMLYVHMCSRARGVGPCRGGAHRPHHVR